MPAPEERENSRMQFEVDVGHRQLEQPAAEVNSRPWQKILAVCAVVIIFGLLVYELATYTGEAGIVALDKSVAKATKAREELMFSNQMAKEEGSSPAGVDEKTYNAWKEKVLNIFSKEDKWVTDAIPVDYKPAFVVKKKISLAAIPRNALSDEVMKELEEQGVEWWDALPSMVSEGREGSKSHLPQKKMLTFWHIDRMKKDGVSFGFDDRKNLFKYPACDFGGLTNVPQPFGKPSPFLDGVFIMESKDNNVKKMASQLTNFWSKHAALPDDHAKHLEKLVSSVREAFIGCDVVFRFHQVPPEHRVLVTSGDVIRATGSYFLRNHGGDDTPYARRSDGTGFICAVAPVRKFITTNYNLRNIKYDCVPYEGSQDVTKEAYDDWRKTIQGANTKSPLNKNIYETNENSGSRVNVAECPYAFLKDDPHPEAGVEFSNDEWPMNIAVMRTKYDVRADLITHGPGNEILTSISMDAFRRFCIECEAYSKDFENSIQGVSEPAQLLNAVADFWWNKPKTISFYNIELQVQHVAAELRDSSWMLDINLNCVWLVNIESIKDDIKAFEHAAKTWRVKSLNYME